SQATLFRCEWSTDGQVLALEETDFAGGTHGVLATRLWRPRTEAAPVPLPGANSLPVFSGDGRLLATTSDTQARLWDVGTMRERQFPVAFAYCAMIHLLKDGHIYVTEYHGEGGWLVDPTAITLWSFGPDLTVAGKPLRMPGARSAILSADGKFATGWQRNRETALLQLYELPTGRELGRLPTFMRGGTVGFSRD